MYRVNSPCSSQSRLLTAARGSWPPQPGDGRGSCSISPGPGCSAGTGCTAHTRPAPAHLGQSIPEGGLLLASAPQAAARVWLSTKAWSAMLNSAAAFTQ